VKVWQNRIVKYWIIRVTDGDHGISSPLEKGAWGIDQGFQYLSMSANLFSWIKDVRNILFEAELQPGITRQSLVTRIKINDNVKNRYYE